MDETTINVDDVESVRAGPSAVASTSTARAISADRQGRDAILEVSLAMVINNDPIKTSILIEKYDVLPAEVLKLYHEYVLKLNEKKVLPKREREFVQDYFQHLETLKTLVNRGIAEKARAEGKRPPPETQIQDPLKDIEHIYDEVEIKPIKKNELVIEPEQFDGVRPSPRKWIDDFERAATANSWKRVQMVTYFPTYLNKTAYDWYVTRATKKLGPQPSWAELKAAFIKHYLGDQDKQQLRRQLEKTYQGDRESITVFMPRILRLMELVYPLKTEEEQVEMVRERLRASYQERLAIQSILDLDELNELCLRLEGGMAAARSATFREKKEKEFLDKKQSQQTKPDGKQNNNQKQNYRKPGQAGEKKDGGEQNKPSTSNVTCHKCNRKGHYANKCFARTKLDGTPNKSANNNNKQSTSNVNSIQQDSNDNTNSKTETANNQPAPVVVIRRAGASHACTKPIGLVIGQSGVLLSWPCRVNNQVVQVTIDCGAAVSCISPELAATHGWTSVKEAPALVGAGGEHLKTEGVLLANVELTVDKTTVATTHDIIVLTNLSYAMILGLDLLQAFRVNICPYSTERPLFFNHQKTIPPSGVRVAETKILAPRSVNFVDVKVLTDAPCVATRPYNFDASLLLANSISGVVNNRTTIMLANIDIHPVRLERDQQVASFEEYLEVDETSPSLINSVMRLGDTSETIQVGEELDEAQLVQLAQLFSNHIGAFSINGSIGCAKGVTHDIVLKDGVKPFAEPIRRRPLEHVEETRRQIKQMLEEGIIEPSSSPWASAYVVVKKKNGEYRLCVDFRTLNRDTVKDSYPLPHIEACIESVAGKTYYSTLDFASGFWQLPIAAGSKDLTAFRTEDGHWQFKRMPFGLCNAPSSFQRLMNATFSGLKGVNLQIFIDDICLATDSWEEHINLLERVLIIVKRSNLKLKAKKCVVGARSITFLGHKISKEGIQQDPAKLRALTELPRPHDLPSLRRVLGMFSYYRKFVPNFAAHAEPLTRLTKKSEPFTWSSAQEKAFTSIIRDLKQNATLACLKEQGQILLKTDASRQGVAGILMQQHDGVWRIVSCCSRRLTPAEENYSVTDLEALAMIYSCERFYHYLLGREFVILTDHCPLCVLNKKTPQSPRVRRWAIFLSQFNFEIVYTKGSLHQDVDCLSRAPVEDSDVYLERIMTIRPVDIEAWLEAYDDAETAELLEKAEQNENDFQLKGGLIYKGDKLFVPLTKRTQMIRESHDEMAAGHDGASGTLARMSHLWWPQMSGTVADFVASCDVCQRRKADQRAPAGLMRQHESYFPLDRVAFDYVGPLPETVRHQKFVLVAVDVFTRYVDARAMKDQTGARFARYLSSFCGKFGPPKTMTVDNALNFSCAETKLVQQVFGITSIPSAGRYSRGNAPVERQIRTFEDKINMILKDPASQLDWGAALPIICLSINTHVCASTKFTPFELMFGRNPRPVQRSLHESVTPHDLYARVLNSTANETRADAVASSSDAHQRAKERFDRGRRDCAFKPDDLVLVKSSDRRKKLADRWEGPFIVLSKANDIYKLKELDTNRCRDRHISQIKQYIARDDAEA